MNYIGGITNVFILFFGGASAAELQRQNNINISYSCKAVFGFTPCSEMCCKEMKRGVWGAAAPRLYIGQGG